MEPGRIVLIAQLHEMFLEAGVAAAAEDVSLGIAEKLAAEESVLSSHLAWVLRKMLYLGKVLMRIILSCFNFSFSKKMSFVFFELFFWFTRPRGC